LKYVFLIEMLVVFGGVMLFCWIEYRNVEKLRRQNRQREKQGGEENTD
jgi:hypothetical protein